jgi:hypothetical protein
MKGGLGPNQALHHDRGRILVSRDIKPLQRPRRVNWCVRAPKSLPRVRTNKGTHRTHLISGQSW